MPPASGCRFEEAKEDEDKLCPPPIIIVLGGSVSNTPVLPLQICCACAPEFEESDTEGRSGAGGGADEDANDAP